MTLKRLGWWFDSTPRQASPHLAELVDAVDLSSTLCRFDSGSGDVSGITPLLFKMRLPQAKFKLYTRFRTDLWYELLLKRRPSTVKAVARLLRLRQFPRKWSLLNPVLPRYRPQPRRRTHRPTRYKKQLLLKQRLRLFYGILQERKFKRFFRLARSLHGPFGENLLALLESRLSTLLVRAGFLQTTLQARQFIGHFGVRVEGRVINRPGVQLVPGELVQLPFSPPLPPLNRFGYPSHYLEVSYPARAFILLHPPSIESVRHPFRFGRSLSKLVAFYTR